MTHLATVLPATSEKMKKQIWKVNLLLLPLKIHYFLFLAGLSCALPFRTVFAKQLGVSATAVGVIFLAVPFMKLITNPFFGFIMDYFKRFRLTLAIIMLVVALSHVAMVFIPQKESNDLSKLFEVKMDYSCKPSPKYVPFVTIYSELKNPQCDAYKEFSCHLVCDVRRTLNTSCQRQEKDSLNLIFDLEIKSNSCSLHSEIKNNKLHVLYKNSENSTYLDSNVIEIREGYHLNSTYFINISEQRPKQNKNNSTQRWANLNKPSKDKRIYEIAYARDEEMDFMCNFPCEVNPECKVTRCRLKVSSNEVIPNEYASVQFWTLFALMAISSVSFSAVLFLVDAVTYEMLGSRGDKYGEQRLWGTIGWGLGALAGGYLNQIVSTKTVDYAPSFYLLAALTILDLIPLSQLKIGNVQYSSNICKDVGLLLCKGKLLLNIIIVYSIGVLSGLIWNYQFWFMEEIGASQLLLGLSQTFECLFAELPCFLVAGWIIKKIGHSHCNSITFLCFGLRYLCFVYMQNPWMTLPAGLLHGPTFGLFYASMTMYAKTEAPPGTEATVQGLLAMSFEGIGAATGSILGGIGFDNFGSRKTFLYAAFISFILLGMNLILHVLLFRSDQKKPDPEIGKEKS